MTDNKHGMTETNTLELVMNNLLSLFQYKIEECISCTFTNSVYF